MKTNCNLSYNLLLLCAAFIKIYVYLRTMYVVKVGRDRSLVLCSTIANLELIVSSIRILVIARHI